MFRTLVAAVSLAAAIPASGASTDVEMHQVQARVSVAGLDLSDPADVAQFEKRLAQKAKLICQRGVHSDLRFSPEVDACRASVTANGMAQMSKLVESRRSTASAAAY